MQRSKKTLHKEQTRIRETGAFFGEKGQRPARPCSGSQLSPSDIIRLCAAQNRSLNRLISGRKEYRSIGEELSYDGYSGYGKAAPKRKAVCHRTSGPAV